MEQFQVMLTDTQESQGNPLFDVLRTIQHLTFSVDEVIDGIDFSGWTLWT